MLAGCSPSENPPRANNSREGLPPARASGMWLGKLKLSLRRRTRRRVAAKRSGFRGVASAAECSQQDNHPHVWDVYRLVAGRCLSWGVPMASSFNIRRMNHYCKQFARIFWWNGDLTPAFYAKAGSRLRFGHFHTIGCVGTEVLASPT